jgi:hypothetical protein
MLNQPPPSVLSMLNQPPPSVLSLLVWRPQVIVEDGAAWLKTKQEEGRGATKPSFGSWISTGPSKSVKRVCHVPLYWRTPIHPRNFHSLWTPSPRPRIPCCSSVSRTPGPLSPYPRNSTLQRTIPGLVAQTENAAAPCARRARPCHHEDRLGQISLHINEADWGNTSFDPAANATPATTPRATPPPHQLPTLPQLS